MYICLIRLALHVTPFCRTTAGHPPLLVSVAFWDPPRLSALCNACTSPRRTSPPSITSPHPFPRQPNPPCTRPENGWKCISKESPSDFLDRTLVRPQEAKRQRLLSDCHNQSATGEAERHPRKTPSLIFLSFPHPSLRFRKDQQLSQRCVGTSARDHHETKREGALMD